MEGNSKFFHECKVQSGACQESMVRIVHRDRYLRVKDCWDISQLQCVLQGVFLCEFPAVYSDVENQLSVRAI